MWATESGLPFDHGLKQKKTMERLGDGGRCHRSRRVHKSMPILGRSTSKRRFLGALAACLPATAKHEANGCEQE